MLGLSGFVVCLGRTLLSILVSGGQEKLPNFGLLEGITPQAGTVSNVTILTSLKSQNFVRQPW